MAVITKVDVDILHFIQLDINSPNSEATYIELKSTRVQKLAYGLMKIDISSIPNDVDIVSARLRIDTGNEQNSLSAFNNRIEIFRANVPRTWDDTLNWTTFEPWAWVANSELYYLLPWTQYEIDIKNIIQEMAELQIDTLRFSAHQNNAISGNEHLFQITSKSSLAESKYHPKLTVEYISKSANKPVGLKPVGIVVLANEIIQLSWNFTSGVVGDYQKEYEIEYSIDGINYTKITRITNETFHNFAANTFDSGFIYWRIRYKNANDIWSEWSNTVSFLTNNKPDTPVITSSINTSLSTPIVTWTATEKYIIQIQVEDGGVIYFDSNEVITTMTEYTLPKALENNKTYIIKLRVKNNYGLWSDWATKSLSTNFQVPQKPNCIKVENVSKGSVSFIITNPADVLTFDHNELFRREQNGEWEKITTGIEKNGTVEDIGIMFNTLFEYKIRTYADTSGFSDSDIMTANLSHNKRSKLYFADNSDYIDLVYNVQPVKSYSKQFDTRYFAGREKSVTEFGEHEAKRVSISYIIKEEEYEKVFQFLNANKVFLFKDKNTKIYCTLDQEPTFKSYDKNHYSVDFSLIENAYDEVI